MTTENPWLIDYPANAEPVRSSSLPATKSERKLLRYYRRLARKYGTEFYRTIEQITKNTGLSRQTIWRANQRFRERRELSWETGHGDASGGVANLYTLRDPDRLDMTTEDMLDRKIGR